MLAMLKGNARLFSPTKVQIQMPTSFGVICQMRTTYEVNSMAPSMKVEEKNSKRPKGLLFRKSR
jgi:hypothetical protein